MEAHFSSFTPEAMRALGHKLAAEHQQRLESIDRRRQHTYSMVADFRREHRQTEADRRHRAARDAETRRLFVSELKSGVHALRNRFELTRGETATDLRRMAAELREAREAFRGRPGHRAGSAILRASRPSPRQPGAGDYVFGPAREREDGTRSRSGHGEKPGHSKKHHG